MCSSPDPSSSAYVGKGALDICPASGGEARGAHAYGRAVGVQGASLPMEDAPSPKGQRLLITRVLPPRLSSEESEARGGGPSRKQRQAPLESSLAAVLRSGACTAWGTQLRRPGLSSRWDTASAPSWARSPRIQLPSRKRSPSKHILVLPIRPCSPGTGTATTPLLKPERCPTQSGALAPAQRAPCPQPRQEF